MNSQDAVLPRAAEAHHVSSSNETAGINPAVGEMIDTAAAFAQPLLRYLRELVHEAVPDAVEEIKWSRPFFTVNGTPVCQMAAFKHHIGFGFWSQEMTAMLKADGIDATEGAGSLGRIGMMSELPDRADLLRYIRAAADAARAGTADGANARRPRPSSKAPIPLPPEFSIALAASKEAKDTFDGLPPSCRREYVEWIVSAKRTETRIRRIQQALERLQAGRRFNDQYR